MKRAISRNQDTGNTMSFPRCFQITTMLSTGMALLLSILSFQPALAWIYPEHRDITFMAIQKLDRARQAVLDRLWVDARLGHESRLAVVTADSTQGEKTTTSDYAAWPAIAGDCSVSGANLLDNVLEPDWILGVADV